MTRRLSPAFAVWAALLVVYLVWGSTYFAIRVAIETLPPLLMAGVRFLLAGALLYAWSIRRGERRADRPGLRQWRSAAIIGVAMLVGGNGAVTIAEQRIPSGLAALLVATAPLWMALLGRMILKERLSWLAVVGLAMGFGGMVLLVRPSGRVHVDVGPMLLVLGGALCWASGSLYAKRAPLPARAGVGTGMEMLCAGAVFCVVGAAIGELGQVHLDRVSAASVLALAYLVTFGSILAFSAYIWLLGNVSTSLAGTYAYVNPVVAVALGWALLGEPVTPTTLVAGAVIVVAVALIALGRRRGSEPPPAEAAEQQHEQAPAGPRGEHPEVARDGVPVEVGGVAQRGDCDARR